MGREIIEGVTWGQMMAGILQLALLLAIQHALDRLARNLHASIAFLWSTTAE
jgi:hypothetical protein